MSLTFSRLSGAPGLLEKEAGKSEETKTRQSLLRIMCFLKDLDI
jgi:hypothetical protein